MSQGEATAISAFIIALNEADRIGHTIESLRDVADEIIVIDSGSNDGTQEAAAKLGAKVVFNPWPGFGMQKRFGEDQCRHHWLLNLDADEVLSKELQDEIKALFSDEPPHRAYTMRIAEMLPGSGKPFFSSHGQSPIRLYEKRCGRFSDSPVHDHVHIQSGSVGALKHIALHYSSRSLSHSLEKINRYSSMQADDMIKRGRTKFLRVRLVAIFPLAFCKAYFLRGYWKSGMAGFVNSVLYAFSRFVRLAKVHERLGS